MNAANSLILHSQEKKWLDTGHLTSIPVNVSGSRYSKQIEFQEELMNFLTT